MPQDKNRRVGPRKQPLVSLIDIHHHNNCSQHSGVGSMTRQNSPSQLPLQRRKSKNPQPIPPQNKLHRPVTQPAHPVIKQNRMHTRFIFWQAILRYSQHLKSRNPNRPPFGSPPRFCFAVNRRCAGISRI
jgi:hypothetical protein